MPQTILLTILGDRDPTHFGRDMIHIDDPGPVLELLEIIDKEPIHAELRPDLVCLLYIVEERKDTERRVNRLKQLLGAESPPIQVDPFNLGHIDPTNYAQLLRSMGTVVAEIRSRYPDAHLVTLTSPGTPQMQGAWLTLGNEGRLPGIFLQKREGKRTYDTPRAVPPGRVLERTCGEIVHVKFSPLFESESIRTALEMFSRYDFVGAQIVFSKLEDSYSPERAKVALWLSRLCEILRLWSLLDYAAAQSALDDMIPNSALPPELTENKSATKMLSWLLQAQDNLKDLVRNDLSATIVDLVCSADRQYRSGAYLDCIWRCASSYEIMLTRALKEPPHLKTFDYTELGTRDIEIILRNDQTQLNNRGIPRQFRLTASDPRMLRVYQARTTAGTPAPFLDFLIPHVKKLVTEVRNNLLHDLKRFTPDQAADALKVTRICVSMFFGLTVGQMKRMPLAPETIKTLTLLIGRILREAA